MKTDEMFEVMTGVPGRRSPGVEPDRESRSREFLEMFNKGAAFTQEILKENERLRFDKLLFEEQVTTLQRELSAMSGLQQQVQTLLQEKQDVMVRVSQVEQENNDFATRYVEVESENNTLANLYVASYQLHSTLDAEEVVQTLMEVVINLVGAEEFVIYLLDDKTHSLHPLRSEGVAIEGMPVVGLTDNGSLSTAVKVGQDNVTEDPGAYQQDFHNPMATIVLKIKDRIIGAIAIYKLLGQKPVFTNLDRDLFSMLGGHAATAIFASRLYSESERKFSTVQGFLKLLATPPYLEMPQCPES